jgi:hypothetical protein
MLALAALLISQTCLRLGNGLVFYRELEDHSAHIIECFFLFAVVGECVSKYKELLGLNFS